MAGSGGGLAPSAPDRAARRPPRVRPAPARRPCGCGDPGSHRRSASGGRSYGTANSGGHAMSSLKVLAAISVLAEGLAAAAVFIRRGPALRWLFLARPRRTLLLACGVPGLVAVWAFVDPHGMRTIDRHWWAWMED